MIADRFKCYEDDNGGGEIEALGRRWDRLGKAVDLGLGIRECVLLLAWIATLISVVMPPHYIILIRVLYNVSKYFMNIY